MLRIRTKFLLRQPNSKGIKAIYATVRYNNQTAIIYPGISIHTDAWIRKNGQNKPKDIPDNFDIMDQLDEFAKLIRDTHKDLQSKNPTVIVCPKLLKTAVYAQHLGSQVEKAIAPAEPIKDKRILITDFFQIMIDDSRKGKRLGVDGRQLTESTISTYEPTKKHFEDFQKNRRYYLADISQNIINGFSDYLNIDCKMAANGSGKHMKNFRTMMNYARQKKLINSDVISDNKVTVTKETPDNIYLTEQEIDELMDLKDFEWPLLEVVRDYFVIACKTALRFSDFSNLPTARIDDEFIRTNQIKVNERVTIPIHEIVAKILNKYNGNLPKCPANSVFNKSLKVIGRNIPSLHKEFEKTLTRSRRPDPKIYKRFELLTTHSARRTFCTNEYLNGMPTLTIMAITGHKTEKSFLSYIKADSLQRAMQARDFWNKKKSQQHSEQAI